MARERTTTKNGVNIDFIFKEDCNNKITSLFYCIMDGYSAPVFITCCIFPYHRRLYDTNVFVFVEEANIASGSFKMQRTKG